MSPTYTVMKYCTTTNADIAYQEQEEKQTKRNVPNIYSPATNKGIELITPQTITETTNYGGFNP